MEISVDVFVRKGIRGLICSPDTVVSNETSDFLSGMNDGINKENKAMNWSAIKTKPKNFNRHFSTTGVAGYTWCSSHTHH